MEECSTMEYGASGVAEGKGRFGAYLALVAAVLMWGGSFPAMRVSVQALGPWAVMWARMGIALVVLLPFLRRLPFPYRKGDWKLLLPMILFQPCLYFLLEANALCYTTSSQAGVISSSVPLLVAAGAALFLGERMGVKTMIGMAASMAGVIGLTMAGDASGQAQNPVLGNGLELAAMASASANMIIVKKLCTRYSPFVLTSLQIFAGVLFFSPGTAVLMQSDVSIWSTELVVSLLFLGVFVTYGAFALYNWAMTRVEAGSASIFINLIPVVAAGLGWTLLGESLSIFQMACAALALAGVWYSQKNGGRARRRVAEQAVVQEPAGSETS